MAQGLSYPARDGRTPQSQREMTSTGGMPLRVLLGEYARTSHLRANGVNAPMLVVFNVINLQPSEEGSPWRRLPESGWPQLLARSMRG